MSDKSKLLKLRIENIGCIGNEGIDIDLDNIICLVGTNNSGKSTILRAYELALGKETFTKDDFCKRTSDKKAAIELLVHIPKGTPNIAEEWKIEKDGYLIVKTRWEWDENLNKVRKTWDPVINDYAEKSKASGLDNVFYSRLPKPFRIGTLESPEDEQEKMKRIILQPIADELDKMTKDDNSELSQTLKNIKEIAKKPISEHEESIKSIKDSITKQHQQIFPELSIEFGIGLSDFNIKPSDLLYRGSTLNFKEGDTDIDWKQQGTGSQRALFWSLMQVRSKLQTVLEESKKKETKIKDIEKKIFDSEQKLSSLKQAKAIESRKLEIEELKKELDGIKKDDSSEDTSVTLPGYMLIIDEPEIALHPNAVRAASKYLYDLSNDPSWQVMLTTHSPIFVDPTQDHTTIVRLDRSTDNPSPKVYITDKAEFEEDEITVLKMLNRYDLSLSEIFFGQYPIIIEGDTEYTAFDIIMNMNLDKYPISNRPILFRARGKWTIPLVIKMLRHFKINFSVLHDSDVPFTSKGNKNGIWKANSVICDEINKCIKNGLKIKYCISLPNFEYQYIIEFVEEIENLKEIPSIEKPWNIFQNVKKNKKIAESIEKVLDDLIKIEKSNGIDEKVHINDLLENVQKWSKKYDKENSVLYFGKK
jgi:putative ATP-dependent endonuclease of the OLD family